MPAMDGYQGLSVMEHKTEEKGKRGYGFVLRFFVRWILGPSMSLISGHSVAGVNAPCYS